MRCTIAACLVVSALSLYAGCQARTQKQTHTDFSLGTIVSITVYNRIPASGKKIIEEQFANMHELERRMSTSELTYDTSPLLELNRAAGSGAYPLDPDSIDIINTGLDISHETGGNFNIAIWPLSRLWDYKLLEEQGQPPLELSVTAARALTDFRGIHIDTEKQTVTLPLPGMGVDVGGIAKGWVAGRTARALADAEIAPAIVDIGGNIITVGSKRDGSLWKIGVQKPDAPQGTTLGVLSVEGTQAVVTSGDYERYFEHDGTTYHHIIDPQTGYPVRNNLRSVTVVSPDAVVADALSTGLFVMGLPAGYAYVVERGESGLGAVFVTDSGDVIVTPRLAGSFSVEDSDYKIIPYGGVASNWARPFGKTEPTQAPVPSN